MLMKPKFLFIDLVLILPIAVFSEYSTRTGTLLPFRLTPALKWVGRALFPLFLGSVLLQTSSHARYWFHYWGKLRFVF